MSSFCYYKMKFLSIYLLGIPPYNLKNSLRTEILFWCESVGIGFLWEHNFFQVSVLSLLKHLRVEFVLM